MRFKVGDVIIKRGRIRKILEIGPDGACCPIIAGVSRPELFVTWLPNSKLKTYKRHLVFKDYLCALGQE